MTRIQRRSAAIHEADVLLSYRSTLHEFYFVFGHMFSSKTLMNADKMLSKCRIRLWCWDTGRLHVAAVKFSDVEIERLFLWAEFHNWNRVLSIFREIGTQHKLPENLPGLGEDLSKVTTVKEQELLRKWEDQGGLSCLKRRRTLWTVFCCRLCLTFYSLLVDDTEHWLFISFLPIGDRTMIFQMQNSNITGFQDVFANDCIDLVALGKNRDRAWSPRDLIDIQRGVWQKKTIIHQWVSEFVTQYWFSM